MKKILILMLCVGLSGYTSMSFSDDYNWDAYNKGYDHGYDDDSSVDYRKLENDPAYEDGVMDGEDEADREHVENGGTLNYPHPDSY
tara:strand:+ start:247 stop:504 length:258 start_codon:yes stop_codon:yes gene_type:complete